MLCGICEATTSEAGPDRVLSAYKGEAGWDRLQLLICEKCGRLLPPVNPTEQLLSKITQLARFGLNSGARPLLRHGRRDS